MKNSTEASAKGSNIWSKPHNVKTIVQSVPLDFTTYLYHGDSYSIIVREKSEFESNFNINIKTPVVFVNCLPLQIDLKCINNSLTHSSSKLQAPH